MRIPWTDEEIELLRKMVERGIPPREMTQVLRSRTISSIYGKCGELGLSLKQTPDIDYETFRSLVGEEG